MAEDAWNTREPERVSLAYTVDNVWRNRAEFLSGREMIVQFLRRKWAKELGYRLIKEFCAFDDAVSRCGSPMNGEMIPAISSALMVMKIGSLT